MSLSDVGRQILFFLDRAMLTFLPPVSRLNAKLT